MAGTLKYDYSTVGSSSHTWTSADFAALVSGGRIQFAIQAKRPEAQSIQLTIQMGTENGPDNTGAMCRLEALTLEVAGEPGLVTVAPGAKR
jgi:hypothetical protein